MEPRIMRLWLLDERKLSGLKCMPVKFGLIAMDSRNMAALMVISAVTRLAGSLKPATRKLFFSLDEGCFKPQKGQAETERLISFLQPGQSRELLLRCFDIGAISVGG